jgi:hypothetical protein
MRCRVRHIVHTGHVFTCVVLLLALVADVARAQETTASLRGRVTDSAGRPLDGVTVTAQSSTLLRDATMRTSADGHYLFTSLPPGAYVIAFVRSGLVTVKRRMTLSAGEPAASNVVLMAVNGFDGAISVTGDMSVFPPSWATTLTSRRSALHQLPVIGAVRSSVALATDLVGVRPEGAIFLIDGLPLRHGWQPGSTLSFLGPGPEALQEVAIVPGRLPADFGRLQSGAIMAVTQSGGNRLAGSVRVTFDGADANADSLTAGRPADGTTGAIEYTLGGPIARGRTWFFAAGRHLTQSVADHTRLTGLPFATDSRDQFGEGKLTHALGANHRLEAQWIGARFRLNDAMPLAVARVADSRALETRVVADRALSASYTGRLGGWLQLTGRYTRETGTVDTSDVDLANDPVSLTRLQDQATGAVWWATGGCPGCGPDRRVNDTWHATASSRLSAFGSHHLLIGADLTRDRFDPASLPSGGLYQLRATRAALSDGQVHPVLVPGGSSWLVWFPDVDDRTTIRTQSFFLSDRWMAGRRLAIDLGVRWDRYRGEFRADGRPILSERALSPRVSLTWKPGERLPWTFTAGYARYVDQASDRRLDGSFAGARTQRAFVYDGPPINTVGPLVGTDEALSRVFDWFFSQGGASQPAWFVVDPGVSTAATGRVSPPQVAEWSFGVGRLLGEQGHARADVTWRRYLDIPGRDVDPGASPVFFDRLGQPLDAGVAAPNGALEREYAGLTLQARYRLGHYASFDAQYTASQLRGNADASMLTGDLFAAAALAYPEYTVPAWHTPIGRLADDVPQRLRIWMHSELLADEKRGEVILNLVYSRESGRPYGAVGWVGVEPHVVNPGYQQPPVAVRYFFTPRDAFRTPAYSRADLALTYRRRLPGSVHGQLFGTFHILNLFDRVRVIDPTSLTVTRTAFTDPGVFLPFNPFTEVPVRGVHWAFDDRDTRVDTAQSPIASSLGRAFRLSIGIRF